jgi:D-inositol-3-phosphate glycosyltransferase
VDAAGGARMDVPSRPGTATALASISSRGSSVRLLHHQATLRERHDLRTPRVIRMDTSFHLAADIQPTRRLAGRETAWRVLMIVSQSGGGIWHYACSLSRALAAAGVETVLAAPHPFEPTDVLNDIPVVSLGTRSPRAVLLVVSYLRRMLEHLDKLRRFHRLVVSFRPDIIHFHDRFGQLDFLYFWYLKCRGVRIVFTAHEVRPSLGSSKWLDKARLRQSHAVLVHSSNGATDLVLDGIDASRIIRIPHGNYMHFCHNSGISATEAKCLLGIPPNGRSILFFGFIAPYKGLSVLLDAFSLLCKRDHGIYLVIAGKPTEDFASYKRRIQQLGLQKRVISDLRYIPFDEFAKFFLAADVVALPYQRIYQSGVLQLAYAFGRPVVVTNVGGLGPTVSEDCTGLVAPATDAQAVASTLGKLLSDPVAAEEMGKRGRQLAETKYSWDGVAHRIIDVYRCLPPGHQPRNVFSR